jgi:hypothetical protein
MDRTQFQALGVQPVPSRFRGSHFIERRRAYLAGIGCGRPVGAPPAGPR